MRPRFLELNFVCRTADELYATVEALARKYDPDSGDTISEYAETLGVGPETRRMVKSRIREIEREKKKCLLRN